MRIKCPFCPGSYCQRCGGSGEVWDDRKITSLLDVIQDVHGQRGDDVCWMDIDRIFVAAGLSVPDRRVGDKAAMKANCERFIDVMCQGGSWPSYAKLQAERDKLQAFKEWVHAYLDRHGVPHHPPGIHGAEGCRIGDRMDWLMAPPPGLITTRTCNNCVMGWLPGEEVAKCEECDGAGKIRVVEYNAAQSRWLRERLAKQE